MTLKAVLFDLDGTLLDTAPDFVTALNLLLTEENRKPLDYQTIRNTVSNGAKALVQLGFHLDETDSDFERIRQRLLTLYNRHLVDKTRPFDGINDVLAFVAKQGMAWGVVTNKPFVYTDPLLKQMPFAIAPQTVICPDHVTHRKPHPEPMLLACKQVGCRPFEAIYIGDHRRDIESAQNASMLTIACAYGYIETNDNIMDWHANYTVQHASEIIPILKNLANIHS
jgi:N-acetyl-D-muramate 6-phosphate phosphatase